MRRFLFAAALALLAAPHDALATTWQERVDAVIGWKGQDMPDGVHRYTLTPQVKLLVEGTTLLPNLVVDGYAAFKHEGDTWLMTAELAMPDARVDAVVRTADAHGLEVTVHNHTLRESPRTKFVHFTAVGDAVQMARALKATIAGTRPRLPNSASEPRKRSLQRASCAPTD